MDKQNFILKILMLLAVTAIVIMALISMQTQIPPDRFSVSATGRVFAKADIANLTIGFKTEVKTTAAEAVQENSEKMNDVIKELKSLDIEAKDIQTSSYNLNPVYDWTESTGQRLKGYQVTQNVTIKIRDLDKIGDAIAKTAEQGANQVGNINFTIDDEYELKNEARAGAIEKAQEKARAIALETGMKLGKIVNIYENQVYYPDSVNYSRSYEAIGIGGGGAIDAPTIEAGQNEVQVEVTLVYEVK